MSDLPSASKDEPVKVVPSTQLALKLFEDFPGAITDADTDVGYNKPKTLIQVSALSFLSRKALNACYFLVSDMEQDGLTIANLAYFRWLIGFDSRNSAYLKKALKEAQKSTVEISVIDPNNPEKDVWLSVPLLGKVAISGGQIAFDIDRSIRNLIRNPEQFSYLSLRILASFTSQYASELYEKALPFLHEGTTPWIKVEDIGKNWISLKGDQTEFKYINRDVLTPAIKQINEMSNITISIEKKKAPGSLKVLSIRFVISENSEGKMVIGADYRSKLKELHNILREEFGLSDSQIEQIAESSNGQSVEKLWSAIEYTRSRIESGAKIGIPAKYLMSALEGGWTAPKIRKPSLIFDEGSTEKKFGGTLPKIDPLERESLIGEFLSSFMKEPNFCANTWAAFLKTTQAKLLANHKGSITTNYQRSLEDEDVRVVFAVFLKKKFGKVTTSTVKSGLTRESFDALPEEKKREILTEFRATLTGLVASSFDKRGLQTKLVEGAFANWLAGRS